MNGPGTLLIERLDQTSERYLVDVGTEQLLHGQHAHGEPALAPELSEVDAVALFVLNFYREQFLDRLDILGRGLDPGRGEATENHIPAQASVAPSTAPRKRRQ